MHQQHCDLKTWCRCRGSFVVCPALLVRRYLICREVVTTLVFMQLMSTSMAQPPHPPSPRHPKLPFLTEILNHPGHLCGLVPTQSWPRGAKGSLWKTPWLIEVSTVPHQSWTFVLIVNVLTRQRSDSIKGARRVVGNIIKV